MRNTVYIMALLTVLGCQDLDTIEKPENLIPRDKMATVLAEAYINNAARSTANLEILRKGIKLDALFYEKYGMDSIQFQKSNAYYTNDVEGYRALLEKVKDILLKKQEYYDTLSARELRRKLDSIERTSNKKNTTPAPTATVQDSVGQ
ncbi:MAG: DUF4296 domain-containing protein [Marinirhabdus sp.]